MSRFLQRFQPSSNKSLAGLALVTTATAVAAWVAYRSRRAGRDNPTESIEVDGQAVFANPAVIPWSPADAKDTAQAGFAA